MNLAYVGSKGTHLTVERQLNQLQPLPASENPFGPNEPLTIADCTIPPPGLSKCESRRRQHAVPAREWDAGYSAKSRLSCICRQRARIQTFPMSIPSLGDPTRVWGEFSRCRMWPIRAITQFRARCGTPADRSRPGSRTLIAIRLTTLRIAAIRSWSILTICGEQGQLEFRRTSSGYHQLRV